MTEPPRDPYSWFSQIYPACSGDGWEGGVVWLPPPDHPYTEDPASPGQCECAHTESQHDPAAADSDVNRIVAVSMLNMTEQQHRMVLGDARTQNETAWTSPWSSSGDDREWETPYPPDSIYMHPDGHPYRIRCN